MFYNELSVRFMETIMFTKSTTYSLLASRLIIGAVMLLSNIISPKSSYAAENTHNDDDPAHATQTITLTENEKKRQLRIIIEAQQQFIKGNTVEATNTMYLLARQTSNPSYAKVALNYAIQSKNLLLAFKAIHVWSDLEPSNRSVARAEFELGESINDVSEFATQLREDIKQSKNTTEAIIQVRRIATVMSNKHKTLQLLQEALQDVSKHPEAQAALSTAYLSLKKRDAALESIENAMATAPNSSTIFLQYFRILFPNDPDSAIGAAKQFIAQNPTNSAAVQLFLAQTLLQAKRVEEAYKTLIQASETHPQDTGIALYLGILYYDYGNFSNAKTMLSKALAHTGIDSTYQLSTNPQTKQRAIALLTDIAIKEKNYDLALKLNEDSKQDNERFSANILTAKLLALKTEEKKAFRYINGIIASNPSEKSELYVSKSQIYELSGNATEGLEYVKDRLEYDKFNAPLRYRLAELYAATHDYTRMESAYKDLINTYPSDTRAYVSLATSYMNRNIKLNEALTLMTKALQLEPNRPNYLASMSMLYYKLNNIDDALKYQTRAYNLSNSPLISLQLGKLLWINGAKEQATVLWRNIHLISPNNDQLLATLNRLQVPAFASEPLGYHLYSKANF